MANNRLFVVNTETKEYCCIAKCLDQGWNFGNAEIFCNFLHGVSGLNDKTSLLIGTENDSEFFDKWIKDGINVNAHNEWIYLHL